MSLSVPVNRAALSAAGMRLLSKYGAVGLTLALIAWFCWLATQWFWHFSAPKEKSAVSVPPAVDIRAAADQVAAMHLFGQAIIRKPVKVEEQRPSISQLNLKLKGVFAANGQQPALAIINNGGAKDEPFRVGDEVVPGVKLHSIHPTHVLLGRDGEVEQINIEGLAEGAYQSAAPAQPQPPDIASVRPLSRNELNNTLQDPKQLTNLGRLGVNPGGGMVVEDVPPGSLAERLGLKAGDIIRMVNGQPLSSPSDLSRLYAQLGSTNLVRVDGMRTGRPLQLNYAVH